MTNILKDIVIFKKKSTLINGRKKVVMEALSEVGEIQKINQEGLLVDQCTVT
tara:strand:+ start:1187 stop:1342 length:156 start_codon:yes stop_codon:yes gene_type:complete